MTEDKKDGSRAPKTELAPGTANNEMVLKHDNASAMLTAAREYTARGWVIHPLSDPKDTGNSPGKKPLLANWQKLTTTPPDIETYLKNGCNLGLVCGKASGIAVIDLDSMLFADDLFREDTLKCQRVDGKGHIYFKYNPNLPASKHHDLGIEILSDGSNAVLPPSIHKSGDVYRWINPDAPIIEMSKELEKYLLKLFQTEAELKQILSKCRHCFKTVLKRRDVVDWHGAEGREYMIAVCTDLKANGAADDHIKLFARLVYGFDYNEKQTLDEWNHIDAAKTWKCETMKAKLPAYVNCEKCDERKQKKSKQKNEDKEAKTTATSVIKLYDALYEEVLTSDGFQFVTVKNGNTEYAKYIQTDIKYIPLVNEAIFTGAVKLSSNVLDYGTPQELAEAIQRHIHSYLDVSKDMEVFATWYILLSWVYDRVNTLPYLRAMGDTGCGKSRFLDVIGSLCYKACMVSGAITPAPIYRMIKQWGGTMVLDEADFRDSSEKSEVITILNCGFEKNRPVIRCDQNNVDNLQFLPTYCPKVIATRYTFDDKALESRCLTEKMTQTDRKDIPRVLPTKFYEEQQELRNKLLMFRFKHYFLINGDAGQDLDFGDIEPRLQQATQSFAALFSKVPELMERFRTFIGQYNRELIEERSESFDGMMVQALLKLYEEGNQDISGKKIADRMIADFGLEKASPQAVGKHLKSLKIETKQKTGGGSRLIVWDNAHLSKLKLRYVPSASSPTVNGTHGTNATLSDSKEKSLSVPNVPSVPSIVGESINLVQPPQTIPSVNKDNTTTDAIDGVQNTEASVIPSVKNQEGKVLPDGTYAIDGISRPNLEEGSNIPLESLVSNIRAELITQAKHFPEGINEAMIWNQAYRWDGATEERIKIAIDRLIQNGDIQVLKLNGNIRYIKWTGA